MGDHLAYYIRQNTYLLTENVTMHIDVCMQVLSRTFKLIFFPFSFRIKIIS